MAKLISKDNLKIVWQEIVTRLDTKQDKINTGDTIVTINGTPIVYGLENTLKTSDDIEVCDDSEITTILKGE